MALGVAVVALPPYGIYRLARRVKRDMRESKDEETRRHRFGELRRRLERGEQIEISQPF